jgi:Tfp pilus assembly protein PilW
MREPVAERTDERGTSLVEISVALMVFSILSIMIIGIVMSVTNNANAASHRFDSLGDAQPVMDVLTRDVRAATCDPSTHSCVVAASSTSLTINSALGAQGGATQVTFTLSNGGVLTETDVTDSGQGTSGTRQLSTHILYPGAGATPLFSYLNINGVALTPSQVQSNPGQVAAVSIYLQDNDSSLAAATVTLQATVWIRDAEYAAS